MGLYFLDNGPKLGGIIFSGQTGTTGSEATVDPLRVSIWKKQRCLRAGRKENSCQKPPNRDENLAFSAVLGHGRRRRNPQGAPFWAGWGPHLPSGGSRNPFWPGWLPGGSEGGHRGFSSWKMPLGGILGQKARNPVRGRTRSPLKCPPQGPGWTGPARTPRRGVPRDPPAPVL